MRFVAINKAKRPPPTSNGPTSDYKTLHRIADELAPIISEKIQGSLNAFRDSVNLRDLLAALADVSHSRVESVIPWSDLIDHLDMREELLQAVERAGVASESALKKLLVRTEIPANAELGFEMKNPNVEAWARKRSGELIVEIGNESRQAVRRAVADAIASGADYGTSAQKIKDAVGLTRQGAAAAARYRDMLMEQGVPGPRIQTQVESYRDRLLTQRAETISRTETIAATNQGQLEYWDQLDERGVIDKETAQKVWIVTPDDRLCPICEPLANLAIGLDETFDTDLGPVDAPPAHPNCRCAISLDLGGTGDAG